MYAAAVWVVFSVPLFSFLRGFLVGNIPSTDISCYDCPCRGDVMLSSA